MSKKHSIIISGGKTGGHLFPAIAIAQALEKKSNNINILFIGTNTLFETMTLKEFNYRHKSIISKPVKGGSIFSKISAIIIVLVSMIQASIIIKKVKPDFVLGVGGYSSFAVVLSAWLFKIPIAIHEQNSASGVTNKILARFAKIIFTSFETTKGFENNPKVQYVGNPMRESKSISKNDGLLINKLDPEKITILITGGSQGAKSINNAVLDAFALMKDLNRFNIVHQTGLQDEAFVKQQYKKFKIKAIVKSFINNMYLFLDVCDLVISRSGAGTISELCIKGKPSILIPFPFSADDHQTLNAKVLEAKKAAIVIKDNELTGRSLKKILEGIDESKLADMAKKSKELAMYGAGEKIADKILKLSSKV